MTGHQLYVRICCNLVNCGEPVETTPPAHPTFEANITTGLVITNTGGTIAIKLSAAGTSTAFNRVWACPPKSQGISAVNDWNELGSLPGVAGGFSTITTLYTAKYGVPAVGKKVFVRSQQILNGWEDIAVSYSEIVPASS